MKNKKIVLIILVPVIAFFAGFYLSSVMVKDESGLKEISQANSQANSHANVSDSTDTKVYTCPMHPDVISDKPGICPKCGMDLELKENTDKSVSKSDVKNDKAMDHKGCNGCKHKH